MSNDTLDDEAPPDIPDISSEPEVGEIPELPADLPPSMPAPIPAATSEGEIEVDVDLGAEPESEPPETVEPEVIEEAAAPVRESAKEPPPRRRVQTSPATPIAHASMPPVPVEPVVVGERSEAAPAQTDAEPDRQTQPSLDPELAPQPSPEPRRPVSQPPRPVSQPPRPVSQPPRPVSQPPPPPASEAAALEITPVLAESEPPTEPFHPAPAPEQDADHAATSYPPPPLPEIHSDEAAAPEPAPTSLKPMRMISLGTSTGPESPAEPVLPPSPVPPPVEATSRVAAIPVVSSEIEEGDISFPADEDDSDSTHSAPESDQLTDDDISPESGERISSEDITPPEILVDLEANEGQPVVQAVPPPPPRRDSGKLVKPVTPPSVVEAKEAQRTKQRKAWWEELFGEDFARANAKLKAAQVTREADFIEESLGVAKGGVMLDLACGGGQHAVELATRGYGVVGYDLSLYQLSVAADVAQDAGQKLNLLQGDMREMAFEEMFDGIYCWNTSFGYFEEEKNIAVAQRVFRALRPGGMFLLDIANRDYVVANQPAQTWFEGDGCVCMDDMSVDFITSRLRVKRSLILDDGRTMECVYSIRLYGLHELGKLLHDVGFRVTEASGHPATPGVFFGASSPRIIILAQRP